MSISSVPTSSSTPATTLYGCLCSSSLSICPKALRWFPPLPFLELRQSPAREGGGCFSSHHSYPVIGTDPSAQGLFTLYSVICSSLNNLVFKKTKVQSREKKKKKKD